MTQGKITQTGATIEPGVGSKNEAGPYFTIFLLVRKLFPQYGWYKVNISHINSRAPDGKIYRVHFDDGDQEDWYSADIE